VHGGVLVSRRAVVLAFAVTAILTAVAITGGSAALVPVRVGIIPIIETMPTWVGKAQGFFRDEGLEVELIPNAGGAVGIPAMQGGSIDLTYADVGTILKATEQGLKLRIVTPSGIVAHNATKDSAHFLSLKDGPVEKLTDARGKRVAVNLLGNIVHVYTMAALDRAGLKPGEYTIVEIPYPQMVDALLNKQVDLIYEVEPFKTILLNTGKVRDHGPTHTTIHPNFRVASYVTTERWLTEHEDVARRYQRAYFRSVAFVNEHQKQWGDWAVQYFRLKPELKDQVAFQLWGDTDMGEPYLASLEKTRDIMLKYGFLKTKIDPRSLVFRPR
jgi:NitT/TauT family transport system substrate-binding protein